MARLVILDLSRWRRRRPAGVRPAVRLAAALPAALLVLLAALSWHALGAPAGEPPAAESLARRRAALVELADALVGTDAVLRQGDSGPEVRLLQQALREVLGEPGAVDGVFGPATDQALRRFQAGRDLTVDGAAGPRTLGALADALRALMPRTHTVAAGETLAAIARRYDVSLRVLASVNGIPDPDRIRAGDALWIPDPETNAALLAALAADSPAPPLAAAPAPEPGPETPQRAESPAAAPPPAPEPPSAGAPAPAAPRDPANAAVPIALTFNDGPDPAVTPRLLALLAQHGVRATFFFAGEAAEQQPDLVRGAAAAGHEIANHGWDQRLLVDMTVQENLEEITRAQRVLADLAGTPPRLFRPQGALWDAATLTAARRVGLDLVMWTNIGAEDLPGVDAATLRRRLLDHGTYPGAIVMLHADNPVALEVLAEVLPRWLEQGVEFLTLSELLSQGAVPTVF